MGHERQTRNPLRPLLPWCWCDSKEWSTWHSEGHCTLHLQWISEFFLSESCKLAPPRWMMGKHGVQHGSSHRFIVTCSILKNWKNLYKNLDFFNSKNSEDLVIWDLHSAWSWLVGCPTRLCSTSVPTIPDRPLPSHWSWRSVGFLFHCCFFPQVLFNHLYFLSCTCD